MTATSEGTLDDSSMHSTPARPATNTVSPKDACKPTILCHFPENPSWIPQFAEHFAFPDGATSCESNTAQNQEVGLGEVSTLRGANPRDQLSFHFFTLVGVEICYYGGVCSWFRRVELPPDSDDSEESSSRERKFVDVPVALCVLGLSATIDFSLELLRRVVANTPWVGDIGAPHEDQQVDTPTPGSPPPLPPTSITSMDLQAFFHMFRTAAHHFKVPLPYELRAPPLSLQSTPGLRIAPPLHLLPCLGINLEKAFAGVKPTDLVTLYLALMHETRIVVAGKDRVRVRLCGNLSTGKCWIICVVDSGCMTSSLRTIPGGSDGRSPSVTAVPSGLGLCSLSAPLLVSALHAPVALKARVCRGVAVIVGKHNQRICAACRIAVANGCVPFRSSKQRRRYQPYHWCSHLC